MTTAEDVTLVENAIHNPNEPRHFMRIVPADKRITASINGYTIAEAHDAVVVKEVGRDVYDPVVYFPRTGVEMSALVQIDKSTHCPLKGDTEYFDVDVNGEHISEAAWSYVAMIDGLEGLDDLMGRIAFDTSKVTISSS